ncbi:MAG: PGPGW domain-containing protein [Candidatus Entotheonellia bacterium]
MMITENFLRQARRVVIGVVGFTVLLIGAVLLVLPGPAFIVIPAGLAILAIEFAWARRWLQRIKQVAEQRGGSLFRKTSANQCQAQNQHQEKSD